MSRYIRMRNGRLAKRANSPGGGWYCRECGHIVSSLPEGPVTCQKCGSPGLCGFDNERPLRVACRVPGCAFVGWEDGVNDDLELHLFADHLEAAKGER